jgi:hypothetical protein
VARALVRLPQTVEAMKEGAISYSKARALTRVAGPDTEAKLVDIARNATAGQLDRIVGAMRRADPTGERDRSDRVEERRDVSYYFDDDGMLVMRARLAPEEGALFVRALESARDELFAGKRAHGHADALALVADRSLSETAAARSGADKVMVMLHVDVEVLADSNADGISHFETVRRLPREFRSASPVTAPSPPSTTRAPAPAGAGASSPGPSPVHSASATAELAPSPAAVTASSTPTTSSTGSTAGPPPSPT